MEKRLPDEILKFRKIGLSAPWGDYITKIPAFKEELESFSKSDLFQMPYLELLLSKLQSYFQPILMEQQ